MARTGPSRPPSTASSTQGPLIHGGGAVGVGERPSASMTGTTSAAQTSSDRSQHQDHAPRLEQLGGVGRRLGERSSRHVTVVKELQAMGPGPSTMSSPVGRRIGRSRTDTLRRWPPARRWTAGAFDTGVKSRPPGRSSAAAAPTAEGRSPTRWSTCTATTAAAAPGRNGGARRSPWTTRPGMRSAALASIGWARSTPTAGRRPWRGRRRSRPCRHRARRPDPVAATARTPSPCAAPGRRRRGWRRSARRCGRNGWRAAPRR